MIKVEVQKYNFTFKVMKKIQLPDYSGSVLRGHFGNQLRRTVCLTKQATCDNCPLIKRCSYGRLFENINDRIFIHPYIIEPLPYKTNFINENKDFTFSMILIGDAIEDLSLITFIWSKVFSIGFKHRDNIGFAELTMISLDSGEIIYDKEDENPIIRDHNQYISLTEKNYNSVTIKMITPLRIQTTNDYGKSIILGQENFTIKEFVKSLIRRVKILKEYLNLDFPIYDINEFQDITMITNNIKFTSTKRFSSKQKAEMEFYGLLGEFELNGDSLAKLSLILELCQYLHIGKSTTFGFGKYKII